MVGIRLQPWELDFVRTVHSDNNLDLQFGIRPGGFLCFLLSVSYETAKSSTMRMAVKNPLVKKRYDERGRVEPTIGRESKVAFSSSSSICFTAV